MVVRVLRERGYGNHSNVVRCPFVLPTGMEKGSVSRLEMNFATFDTW